MKKTELLSKTKRMFNIAKFKVKKHSPEILIAAGVAGTIASAIMACRATTKISEILETAKEDIDTIHESIENEQISEKYSPEDAKKDLMIVYTQTGIKLAKLYAPSIALGAVSIMGVLASNTILRRRNVALAAAYATVDKGFKEYRNRVAERFGEDIEHELRYNIKAKQFEKTVVDEKTGKEKKNKESADVSELNEYSDYARFFDERSRAWEKNPEYNLTFLNTQQQFANDKLKANGYLFLNDVYDMLDIPRTKAGQIVGWVYRPDDPIGDNYVDFGIYNTNRQIERDFVNGYEPVILLDFNVDGDILDLI